MTVEVTARIIEATPTAVVRASTTWAAFPRVWRPMLDEGWSFLRGDAPPGLYTDGHNVMFYEDDVPNVEVGVQVTRSFDGAGRVLASTLPGGLVATATHAGAMSELSRTHDAVRAWCAAHGYTLNGPRWEVYSDPDAAGHVDVDVFWSLLAS